MFANRIGAVVLAAVLTCEATAGVASAQPGALPALDSSFLWGVASSGFQSEGFAPDSNWSRYATSDAAHDRYRDSVDFFHRYRSDIALARDLGVRVYRISVEWARLQPQPGIWDEQGFAFYDAVIAAIRAAGMRPMLTLDHWAYPGWVADRGGWRNPGMVADWLANARRVVDRYAAADPLWVTFNEPAFYGFNETRIGALSAADIPAMNDRLVAAHTAIYDYIHSRRPDAMVTSNVAFAASAQAATDLLFEDRVAAKLDYIGIDYYYGTSLANPLGSNPANVDAPWELSLTPEGIYYALRYFARKFPGAPLFIVESGMPTDNGRPRADGWDRADELRDPIYWLQRAKADGMNVIGYNYWSLTDNYVVLDGRPALQLHRPGERMTVPV